MFSFLGAREGLHRPQDFHLPAPKQQVDKGKAEGDVAHDEGQYHAGPEAAALQVFRVHAAVAEDFTDVRVTDDTPGILADPAIDAVAITTLADIRPLLVKEALVQGKHIWAEKPQNRSPPASKTKRN